MTDHSTPEQWRPIAASDGNYEISNLARVRNATTGRVMTPQVHGPWGYIRVQLRIDGRQRGFRVHRLMLEAFIGPAPKGTEGCHRDGNPANNAIENLYWGSKSDNARDRVRHGNHHLASKTECVRGHPFDTTNTIHRPGGGRDCRECNRRRSRDSIRKRRALQRLGGGS